ncbi:MAG: hypothetical protein LBI84_10670 [Propionibacteriaceae bacterium]|jgi:hypothetical protein|nr:hypothetical protein [Propionibacteriaceae bacterium]
MEAIFPIIKSILVTFLTSLLAIFGTSANPAPPTPEVIPTPTPTPSQTPADNPPSVDQIIRDAKQTDPEGFAWRVTAIQQSDALMALMSPDPETRTQYLEAFAATATNDYVQEFVQKTADKHFIVSGTDLDNAAVELVDGPPSVTRRGIRCWRGWVAAAAWYVGTGGLCGAFTVITFGAGIGCSILFWGMGAGFIDWNSAC